MSHIIKSDEDIKIMSQLLEKLRSKGYTNNVLEEILNTIIPNNDKFQVNTIIEKTNNSMSPAFFDPSSKSINIKPDDLKCYIFKLINPMLRVYPNIENEELFRNYVVLVLVHEVEHYYQYLIGNQYIEFPYKSVIDAYKNLESLKISKNTNLLYAILMIKNYIKQKATPTFLFERNANIEAYDLLCKVANYENNVEIKKILEIQKSYYLTFGYKGFYNGSIEESHSKVWLKSLYKSLEKDEDIPIQDKVRYGLPIDRETRKKVLKNKFSI